MSYPRFPSPQLDYCLGLYKDIQDGIITNMYADKAAVWEVRGLDRHQFDSDFEKDFAGASLRLMCEPIAAESALFDPQRFSFVGETLIDIMSPNQSILPLGEYSIGIDAGFKRDYFAVAVAVRKGKIVYIIGLHRFDPNKTETLDIIQTLRNLQAVLNATVYGDSYYAEMFSLYLNFQEIPITRKFYNQDYLKFRQEVYSGECVLPAQGPFVDRFKEELFSVIWEKQTVKHPPQGTKDLLDAVVMAWAGARKYSGGAVTAI